MLFLGHPTRVETLRWWDCPHSESTMLWEFSLSEPQFDVLLMGLPPLGAQTLAYEFPSSEPTERWAPIVSLCRVPSIFRCGEYPCRELPYSDDSETTPLWDFPIRRSTLLLGLLSLRGTRSSHQVGSHTGNGRVQFIAGWHPHFRSFFCRSND